MILLIRDALLVGIFLVRPILLRLVVWLCGRLLVGVRRSQ
jgi:hypothetical protein